MVTASSTASTIDPAHEFWDSYLSQNIEASRTLKRMHFIIEEFRAHAARLIASKCIDGRVHGSKGKGYPPTTVVFSRSEGNNIATDSSNFFFWRRIDEVVIDAARNTPGKPALFIALGHRAVKGHGCAAHGEDDAKALSTAEEQAAAVRAHYPDDRLYALYGMTNTDDGLEALYFPNGTEINAEHIIEEFKLMNPADIFSKEFLSKRIPDEAIDRYIGGKTPAEILDGPHAAMYADLQTALAMEGYLIKKVSATIDGNDAESVFRDDIISNVVHTLAKVVGLPSSLTAALTYQILWNIAHGLYQRRRVETMTAEMRNQHFEHNENVVAYGEGYEAKNRNTILLVKPGRGDDRDALKTARKVLEHNRDSSEKLRSLPLLVHINVELVSAIDSWLALDAKILSDLRSRVRIVREVFGDDVHVLTTYSYRSQKLFYPVRVDEFGTSRDSRGVRTFTTVDLARELNERNFSPTKFKAAEEVYALGSV